MGGRAWIFSGTGTVCTVVVEDMTKITSLENVTFYVFNNYVLFPDRLRNQSGSQIMVLQNFFPLGELQ